MNKTLLKPPHSDYLEESNYIVINYLRFIILTTGIITSVLVFYEIYKEVFIQPGPNGTEFFDTSIREYMISIQNSFTAEIMRDITALGSITVMSIIFIAIAIILRNLNHYKLLLYQFITFIGAIAIPFGLKAIFNRPRPESETWLAEVYTSSFPSGHSFGAAALYLSFAYIFSRFAKSWKQEFAYYLVCFTIVFAVGFSRIYLQVHYTTDVLAGIALGVCWTLIASFVYEYKYRR